MSVPTYGLEKRTCKDCGSKGTIIHRPDAGRFDCSACGMVQQEGVTDLAAGTGGARRDRGDARPDDTIQHTAGLDRAVVKVGARQTGYNPFARDQEIRRAIQEHGQVQDAPPDDVLRDTMRHLEVPHIFSSRATSFLHRLWEEFPDAKAARCKKALSVVCLYNAVAEQNPSQAQLMKSAALRPTAARPNPWATADDIQRMQTVFRCAVRSGRITIEEGQSDRARTLAATVRESVGDVPWLRGVAVFCADMVVIPLFARTGVAGGRRPETITAAALLFAIASLECNPSTRLGPKVVPVTGVGREGRVRPQNLSLSDIIRPILAASELSDERVVFSAIDAFSEHEAEAHAGIRKEAERQNAEPKRVGPSGLFARLQQKRAQPKDDGAEGPFLRPHEIQAQAEEERRKAVGATSAGAAAKAEGTGGDEASGPRKRERGEETDLAPPVKREAPGASG